MSSIRLIKVGMVRDEATPSKAGPIGRPADVVGFLRAMDFATSDRESFVVVHLSGRNAPISVEVVSTGTLNASLVHPREVFKAAILANAASIILAHNHPSGDATPSRDNLELTKRLQEAGKLIGIEVLDHIIVTPDGESLSFKERGLF